DYLTKPFSSSELKARARNLLAAKQARDLLQAELKSSREDLLELAREVTLRRHDLEKALDETRASRDEGQRLMRLRDECISVASHELRTPLTPLTLQGQMLRKILSNAQVPDWEKTKRTEEYLNMSSRQVQTLSRLIETLLDVSRIRLGNFLLNREEGVS